MKVLNFGSMNIDYVYTVEDFVQKGQTISSQDMRIFSGGKGLNSSIALRKAGVPVIHAGMIGNDGFFLKELMKKQQIDVQHVQVLENEKTGHAIIQKNKEGDNCILLYGGANQRVDKKYIQKVLSAFEQGDMIVLQNEISNLKYIVDAAYEKGMQIVLNPSPMNEKIQELDLSKITYLLLNEHEAKQLSQSNTDEIETIVYNLKKLYPNVHIVLTLGEHGSLYIYKDKQVRQEAYKVNVVDTTAAGDTFTGYFLAGLIEGKEIQECMQQAAKASSITVTRLGAAPSIPTKEEVDKLK